MLIDNLKNTYSKGEPIFLDEIKSSSKAYLRLQMKTLCDRGELKRFCNGVYYLPYKTILGTEGKMSLDKYIEKRYLREKNKDTGYITGLGLANKYGFTTQNPSIYEVCSNNATTKQRKLNIDGNNVIIYKPVAKVTNKNKSALQFLDLMSFIDRYSELQGEDLCKKLKEFINNISLDFSEVKKYISKYPDKVYRNIYNGGLMNELV